MSRILRRPMFRGGRVNSYGTGIASGLADGGRVGFYRGGSYLGLPEPITSTAIGRNTTKTLPTDMGILSFQDLFKPVERNPDGSFKPYNPFRDKEREGLENIEDYDIVDPSAFTPRYASNPNRATDAIEKTTEEIDDPSLGDTGIATQTMAEFEPEEPELKKQRTVKQPTLKETEENEVTMTDLERALGLDDARKEYVGDALAAASKAFFEGKGFGAISDAAQVKSKAPEIKRLAGLEEFRAKKTKELYEAKKKDKQFAPGNFEKNDKYLKLKYPELTDRQRLKIQLKKPSSFVEQYIELSNDVGYKNDEVFKDSARLFYDNEYKKDVDVQSVISPDKSTELDDGVYSDAKNKIIFQVKDKVVVSSQNY